MEFYKVIYQQGQYQLEEEAGQDGIVLDNGMLSRLAALLYSCYQQQEQLPLTFRRYLTAYHTSGEMEYIALAEASACWKNLYWTVLLQPGWKEKKKIGFGLALMAPLKTEGPAQKR